MNSVWLNEKMIIDSELKTFYGLVAAKECQFQ